MTNIQPVDVHGKKYNRWLLFILMLLATLAGSLMQSTLGTALPTLMKKFDIDLNTAQQATTWFLLALAIMVPVSAYLVKKFPTKNLTLITYVLLLGGICITAFTPEKHSMWAMFVVGRVLAAAAVGILMPLLQITILNIFSTKERSIAMGLMGLVVGMSPAIGPTLTGWILNETHHFMGITLAASWQTIFYIPMVVLIVVLILTPLFMRDVIPNESAIHLDIFSLVLSSFGFGLFLLGFTNVSTAGWIDWWSVDVPIVVGIIIIAGFVWRQLTIEHPFLDLRVFKSWNFSITTVTTTMAMMAMMGVEMMLPTYLQNVHGMTALDSGLTLLPGALFIGILSPIAGILYSKAGIKRLAIAAFVILIAGTIPFSFLTVSTPAIIITLMYTVRMIGIALALMPLTTAAMDALPQDKTTDGTAVNNTARQLASSVGVAILTSVTQNVIDTNKPGSHLKTLDPLKYAAKTLDASMQGFQVAFSVGLAFAVIGLIVALLFKKNKKEAVN
ncbi:DHA2 family efflux MFS transporter permease subunit [Lactiplantibacillus paraplantarum]|uniref:DHA2 family efflux MFS transporter permease subunit n=1 Tax=Lactiplantibacillus paraplantarum TaxID=60520 RepID=UPI0023AA7216|nr:DHA2 family efflux MFS transporter permease subunit [Lactiplantibacillus paraplantarum]WEE35628.1 DHA2 family efflux MFS transporter permease subunit [Lactiplantibacillus paraplantarum]